MSTAWTKLQRWLFVSSRHESRLVDQLFVNLGAKLRSIEERAGDTPQTNALIAHVAEKLQGERTWQSAQLVEQLMVPLLSDDELTVELRRLQADRREADAEAPAYAGDEEGRGIRQALVERLLKERHWRFECQRLRRHYKRCVRRRVSILFAVSFFGFFAPTLVPKLADAIFHLRGDPKAFYIYSAVNAGLLGACLSMLSDLEKRLKGVKLDDLRSMSSLSFICSRWFTGAAGGIVMFYFLHSGIFSSEILPELSDFSNVSGKDKSLLIILCLGAGFSEKLISGILMKAKAGANLPAGVGTEPSSEPPSGKAFRAPRA